VAEINELVDRLVTGLVSEVVRDLFDFTDEYVKEIINEELSLSPTSTPIYIEEVDPCDEEVQTSVVHTSRVEENVMENLPDFLLLDNNLNLNSSRIEDKCISVVSSGKDVPVVSSGVSQYLTGDFTISASYSDDFISEDDP
jgi:hypothetical protein